MENKWLIGGLLVAIFIAVAGVSSPVTAQAAIMQPKAITIDKYEQLKIEKVAKPPAIYLKSRTITPGTGIDPAVLKRLEAEPQDRVHVLLYLSHIPNAEERYNLNKNGISLLAYIHKNGWIASVPKYRLDEVVQIPPVKWMEEILPDDKLGDTVRTQKFGDWSYDPASNTVNLTVIFMKDVSLNDGRKILSQHGAEVIGEVRIINAIVATVPVGSISFLAGENDVQWIAEIEPPGEDDNDGLREAMGVDTVHAAPYALNGTGIIIAQFEGDVPDITHPGLINRSQTPSGGTVDDHPTHVAGTAAGNGSLSMSIGGTAAQWRGVATNASLMSFERPWPYIIVDFEALYNLSINTYNIDISTNSFSSGTGGDYLEVSQFYDSIVKGNITRPIMVTVSAGNEGRTGYRTLRDSNVGKNVIVVGSTGSDTNDLSAFSSRGPTADNRTKPDLVAPGCENNTYYEAVRAAGQRFLALQNPNNSIFSTVPTTDANYPYYGDCGTSMSTPAVGGSLALLLESYRQNHDTEPLPSSMKAVLIQTAHDLDRTGNGSETNDGPDFMNGWGLVNITRAVDLIMNDSSEESPRIIENIISHGETDIYDITVPAGTEEFKVTLVWDDEPGVPSDGLKELQNDLDIYLIDPLGGIYMPWVLNGSNNTQAAYTGVDDLNNVEQVWAYDAAGLTAGDWQVVVNGSEIPHPKQPYSLIASKNFYSPLHATVLVLDISGSMGWDPYGASGVPENETRLYNAKQASSYFLDLLNLYQRENTSFGVAAFPEQPWNYSTSCAAGNGEAVFNLTEIDNTSRDDAIVAINNLTAHGGTPMEGGVEVALDMLQLNASDRNIVLLSDGYHNCPNRNFSMGLVNDTGVKIYTLAYGNTSDVDHALLQDISNATGAGEEGEGFYVAENTTLSDLVPVFKAVIADILGLYSPVDPAVTISEGETNNHDVYITEHDDKVTFSLSWGEANPEASSQSPLQLEIITPGNKVIDPEVAGGTADIDYISGNTYQLYHVKGDYLTGKTGMWQMRIDTGNLQDGTQATYHYSVLMESDLGMDVSFDSPSYGTGDSILVRVDLKEKGLPAALDKLIVKVSSPIEGRGNWFVENKVSADHMKRIPREKDGEVLPDVYRKYVALTEGLKIPYPSSVTETTLNLYDDGNHADGDANDGIFANYFEGVEKEGIYTFTLFAEGTTSRNNIYTRDRIIKKYVAVNVDAESTQVNAVLDKKLDRGLAQYRITVTPMDALDNYLGPGHANRISVDLEDAKTVGSVVDNLDGSYDIYVTVDTSTTEEVSLNIRGTEVKVNIEMDDGGEPWWLKLLKQYWLLLLVIIIILLILLLKR
jgi:hypothetical protein